MHVFINTSSVKKLEKEKATNKCLRIMFSSISHEFRTPLNAFMNAVELLKLNFATLKTERNFNLDNNAQTKKIGISINK